MDALALSDAAAHAIQAGPPTDDGDFEIFTWYYDTPLGPGANGFMRLRLVTD